MNSKRTAALLAIILASCACIASDYPNWKARLSVPSVGSPKTIQYSPDGQLLAVGDSDGTVRIIDVETGSIVRTISSDVKPIWNVHFLPNSRRLLLCGGKAAVRVFSTSDWSVVGQADGLWGCDVSPDEKLIVGGDGKNQKEALVVWDTDGLKLLRSLFSNGARPVNATFVQNGRLAAVAVSRTPYLIDVQTGQATKIQQAGDTKTQLQVEQRPGNQAIISLGAFQDDDAPTHSVVSSHDGSLIALGRGWFGQPDFVDVWTVPGMKRIVRVKEENTGIYSSISFDNQLLAVGSSKPGTITIYRLSDNKKKVRIPGGAVFQFSPTNLELAVIENGSVLIYTTRK